MRILRGPLIGSDYTARGFERSTQNRRSDCSTVPSRAAHLLRIVDEPFAWRNTALSKRRLRIAAACVVAMLLGVSYKLGTDKGSVVGSLQDSHESQQVLAYSTPTSAPAPGNAQRSAAAASTTPGPTNYKQARFAAAISGLRFDTGVVEVEPADRYDAEFAWARFEQARAMVDAGLALGAITAYRDSIRWAPDLADPYNGLGMILRLQNKMSEALAALRTAVRLDPEFVDARFNLAMTLWMNGESNEATRQMRQVVQLQPDHALAHERLAIWNYYSGQADAAWQHVRAAQALDHVLPPQFMALMEIRMPGASR